MPDITVGQSRPLRARGLKLHEFVKWGRLYGVAPPAGAWIETPETCTPSAFFSVAPPAGAWIETSVTYYLNPAPPVAPPAGAWIETIARRLCTGVNSRAPCGRVD